MSFVSALRQVDAGSPSSARRAGAHVASRRAATATTHPFLKACACALVAWLLSSAIVLGEAALAGTPDAAVLLRALGAFVVASFVPALITGMIVCQSPRAWPFWQIALTFLPMFSLIALLHAGGAAAG